MKLILFVIFIVITLDSITSKNLKPSNIFKVDNPGMNFNTTNKTKGINSTNIYHLRGQKDLEDSYYPKIKIDPRIYNYRPPFKGRYTGFTNITCEDKIKFEKTYLIFLACCVKGGLTSNQQIFEAVSWAKKNKYNIIEKIYLE